MVLVWPNWFGLDYDDFISTKMNWSDPNCDFLPKWITFGRDQFILVLTISFFSWPNHYSQVQINLVRLKPFWTHQNCFGHIEGQDIIILQFSQTLQHKKGDKVINNDKYTVPRYAMKEESCKAVPAGKMRAPKSTWNGLVPDSEPAQWGVLTNYFIALRLGKDFWNLCPNSQGIVVVCWHY